MFRMVIVYKPMFLGFVAKFLITIYIYNFPQAYEIRKQIGAKIIANGNQL